MRVYGRRAHGAAGLGTSVAAAVADVRNRLRADDLESAELRNKLLAFCRTKRTQLGRKHSIRGFGSGAHTDIMVPIATALLRPGANVYDNGSVVWQHGAWAGSPVYRSNGSRITADQRHWIEFDIRSPYIWTGVRPCVRLTSTPSNPPHSRFVPTVRRRLALDPVGTTPSEWHRHGHISLGIGSGLSEIDSVGIVVNGYLRQWQE